MKAFSRPYKIVVIDDDVDTLALVQNNLSSASSDDIEISSFLSMKEALSFISKHQVHIVITDLHLEEANGVDAITKCLQMQKGLQIIALSSDNSFESALECYHRGAKFFIHKPIDRYELIESISKCISFLNYWQEVLDTRREKS